VVANPARGSGQGRGDQLLDLERRVEVVARIVEAMGARELETETSVITGIPEHEQERPAERPALANAGPDQGSADAPTLCRRQHADRGQCAGCRLRVIPDDRDLGEEDVPDRARCLFGDQGDARCRLAAQPDRELGFAGPAEGGFVNRPQRIAVARPLLADAGPPGVRGGRAQPRFPAKKSLPLSSTTMKAGKPTTSIFQIASMPSSSYSTTSTFLMQSWARIAAGPPIEPR
jgi:hypothetical protein